MKLQHLRADAHIVEPVDHPAFLVEPGEVFEVDNELGDRLAEQTENYAPVEDGPAAAPAADDANEGDDQ